MYLGIIIFTRNWVNYQLTPTLAGGFCENHKPQDLFFRKLYFWIDCIFFSLFFSLFLKTHSSPWKIWKICSRKSISDFSLFGKKGLDFKKDNIVIKYIFFIFFWREISYQAYPNSRWVKKFKGIRIANSKRWSSQRPHVGVNKIKACQRWSWIKSEIKTSHIF